MQKKSSIFHTQFIEEIKLDVNNKCQNWVEELQKITKERFESKDNYYVKEIDKLKEEKNSLSEELNKIKNETNKIKDENNNLKEEIKLVKDIQSNFDKLKTENEKIVNTLKSNNELLQKRIKDFDDKINDMELNVSNYKFESNELERGDKLYFRLNIKKYSGSQMKIRLIFDKRFVNSIFIVDVCFFNLYPDEDEILIFSRDWKEILKEKNIEDPDNAEEDLDNAIIEYPFDTNEDDEFLAVQIVSKFNVENFGFIVIPERRKESGLSNWVIIIISIISTIVIFVIVGLIISTKWGKTCCEVCQATYVFCCVCSAIASVLKN